MFVQIQSLQFRLLAVSVLLLLIFSTGCQTETPLPTRAVPAETVDLQAGKADAVAQVPPTWTPQPIPLTDTPAPPPPTSTAIPTVTPVPPTDTPIPIPTNTPEPTAVPPTNTAVPPTAPPQPTAVPATAVPTVPSNPVYGVNILPNGSFEEGHYNQNGIPELQLPNQWIFEWDEGPTGFGSEAWDVYVRPETRVLPASQLPPAEHPLYIYDGAHTVKIFKGYGAISARLMTDVSLEPGTYTLEISLFPDIILGYDGNQKIWPNDPYSGEVRFIAPGGGTNWFLPIIGQKNTFNHTFTITEAQTARVGAGLRGRFALPTNGFFIDNWSLKKIEG